MSAVPKICILGGSGNTGAKLAALLLRATEAQVTLCARSADQLEATRTRLATGSNPERIHLQAVDVKDQGDFRRVLENQDLLVVTAAVTPYIESVARTAMATGTDMLDVIFSRQKLDRLRAMRDDIEHSGRCFITEAGFHPGLPSALVRWAATRFDTLYRANIFGVIHQDWSNLDIKESTILEFIEELQSMDLSFYQDGYWQQGSYFSMKGFHKKSFLHDLGTYWCAPMMFPELTDLPRQIPELKETGFFIAGFHWFIDYVIFPLVFIGLKFWPARFHTVLARFFFHRLAAVSKPPFFTALKLEAAGIRDEKHSSLSLQLSHEDGYWFTAIPVAAAIIQWMDYRDPGLHFMGQYVEPDSFLKQMETFGIHITVLKED
ncbi:MAG: saccharopine dehydrogenase family protein [Fidelibacterota bacterium]